MEPCPLPPLRLHVPSDNYLTCQPRHLSDCGERSLQAQMRAQPSRIDISKVSRRFRGPVASLSVCGSGRHLRSLLVNRPMENASPSGLRANLHRYALLLQVTAAIDVLTPLLAGPLTFRTRMELAITSASGHKHPLLQIARGALPP